MMIKKEVVKKAKKAGITISDETLQEFADDFRASYGLFSADETYRFLKDSGLTDDDFEAFCESEVLTRCVKDHFATEDKIQEYFVNNRLEFGRVRVSNITVKEEHLAREIMMRTREDGEEFHTLARRYSLDEETKYAGGYVGVVSRCLLLPEVAAKVFHATAGDLLGPFLQDKLYRLILVEEVIKAELNDRVKEEIKEKLFYEWTSTFLKGELAVRI